jgi:hypothetical protein
MRHAVRVVVALMAHTPALLGQGGTPDDSLGFAQAVATYMVAHPIGAGGSHGPVTGLVVAPVSRRWNALLSAQVHQIAPTLWMDPQDPKAPERLHVDVRTVTAHGDSVVVSSVWSWCFASGGGESGWPVAYTVVRVGREWQVRPAQPAMVAHGPICSLGHGGTR